MSPSGWSSALLCDMRYASLFLVTLLFAEAIIPPASANLLMLYLPIRATIVAYRTLRFALKMRAFLRTVRLARGMIRFMTERQNEVLGLGVMMGMARDTCMLRLICEISSGQRPGQGSLFAKWRNFMDPEERQLGGILKLLNRGNSCAERFRSCPYSAREMVQALMKYGSSWKDLKLPSVINTRFFSGKADPTKQRK